MQQENILEVITPPLSSCGNTDAYVQSLTVPVSLTQSRHELRYLHTSPEFAMKRLLCAHPATDIYQIATVFRAEEQSLHLSFPGISHRSYSEEVFQRLGQWPDQLSTAQIQRYFYEQKRDFPHALLDDLQACLDLFMDEFVLGDFSEDIFTCLSDYPVSQAALARLGVNSAGQAVAERFEVFYGAVELANGFHELNDATVQAQRFHADLEHRAQKQLDTIPIDHRLLAALESGLPECAGIALGLERLQMVLGKHQHINALREHSSLRE